MQPIGTKRLANTRQLGAALLAGILVSSALWVAALGLTGNLPGRQRQQIVTSRTSTSASGISAEQFFQAKLDRAKPSAAHLSVDKVQTPTATGDRVDQIARLGRAAEARVASKASFFDAKLARLKANQQQAPIRWVVQIGGHWVGRSGDDGAWVVLDNAGVWVELDQVTRHMDGPLSARATQQ